MARKAGKKKPRPLAATAALRIEGLDTEAQCLELRSQYLSLREIGARLNISAEAVRLAILRGMARIVDPDITKAVKISLIEKYELLLEAHLPAALAGEEKAYERSRELMLDMAKVAGLFTEQSQQSGPAIQFNYYTPTADSDEKKYVDAEDYALSRPELDDGRANTEK